MIRFGVGLFTALLSGICLFEGCTKDLEHAYPSHEIVGATVFLCLIFVAGVMLIYSAESQKMKEKREAGHAEDE